MPKERDPIILRSIRRNLFFLLVIGVTIGFVGLIKDFMLTIFWAAVLATIFYKLYRKLAAILKGRINLASTLMTLLILLFVIIPLILLTLALIRQSGGLIADIENQELDPTVVIDYVETSFPKLTNWLDEHGYGPDEISAEISGAFIGVAQTVGSRALSYTGSLMNFFVQFSLMLYLLFFFFRDGRTMMRTIINAIPMGNIRERQLFTRFASVSRATLKGTLTVAIVQGAIGGILFASVGIPAALLWGVAMTLLALLPVGGSAIVWMPAAIILFAQGQVTEAIIVFVVGSLIIGLVDNILRPVLVGRDTQMPDYLVLLSTLGGITIFGLSGFVIGPVIAALFLTVWEMLGKEYGGEMS
ncbi:MAG: AI-2E family transporter [Bacteroidota bacterium]